MLFYKKQVKNVLISVIYKKYIHIDVKTIEKSLTFVGSYSILVK